MVNVMNESKRLALELRENEDRYITGDLDLRESLDKTDELYHQALDETEEPTTACKILHDSTLMKLQTRLARQRAKCYKPDSLVFNATEFSSKLIQLYGQSSASNRRDSTTAKIEDMLWMKMGDFAKNLLHTVPCFNYIHGTFDPDPVEVVKKKRKMKEKDKIGDVTKPESMNLNENKDNQDITMKEAERILAVLVKLCNKSEENLVCYFEFVTDPTSFSRTVENIFFVSLLVKEGCIRIIKDRRGLPYLARINDSERKERNPAAVKQCIITISKDKWQEIVRTFRFKKPLIPPRKAIIHSDSNS